MTDDIQKILDNLDKHKKNLNEAKNKVNKWSDELGFQEELTDIQSKLWKDLKTVSPSYPSSVMASGVSLSQSMLDSSNRVLNDIWNSGIDQSITTSGTASEVLSGVSFSAMVYTPYQANPPQSYLDLNRTLTQRNQQEETAQRLGHIEQSLKNEYNNAWLGVHTAEKDKTRAPMFLIREVVRRLLEHFAPDEKVKEMFPEIKDNKDLHRNHRVTYIASIIDNWRKQTFLNEEKAFNDIYGELSIAHKDGVLNQDETRSILYQADGLIRLLLDCLTK